MLDWEVDWVIDGLIRKKQAHLICGSGGSGKTTLALQMMDAAFNSGAEEHGKVLGLKVQPLEPVLISLDLKWQYYHRKAEELGLRLDEEQFKDATNVDGGTLEDLTDRYGDRELWVIEGFLRLLASGNMNSQHETATLMARLNEICWKKGVTIIGVTPKAKMRKGNEVCGLRDRVAGATALAAGADTVMLLEPSDPDDVKDSYRDVFLLPKDRKPLKISAKINPAGLLELSSGRAGGAPLDRRLRGTAIGKEITTKEILRWDPMVSAATVKRWIAEQLEEGRLVKERHGAYIRPRVN